MKAVYHSLFHSKLQYCITSWGGCSTSNLLPILRLQKRAIRLVCSQSYRTPTHPLFVETRILKLPDLYCLNVCKLVKKMIDGKLDGNLELKNINTTHNYNTRLRQNNNFITKSCNTKLTQSSFTYAGPKHWRKVPPNFKSLGHKTFGKVYKQFLIDSYSET